MAAPGASASQEALAVDVRQASLVFQAQDAPVHALSDIDLKIQSGEFVSLIGPSGCGKTTLLRNWRGSMS